MVQVHICSTKDASTSIKALLASPYFAEIYSTLVDPPIEGETDPNPKANFQKISECQRQNAQMLFSAIRFTEIKARLMDAAAASSAGGGVSAGGAGFGGGACGVYGEVA
jgi:hypothetical protein